MKHNMKHYDPADIANIKQLIMSEDKSNVIIGVSLAIFGLNMTVRDLSLLINFNDCVKWYGQSLKLTAFGKSFVNYTKVDLYSDYMKEVEKLINDILNEIQ